MLYKHLFKTNPSRIINYTHMPAQLFLDSNEIKAMLPQSVHLSDMAMIYVEGNGDANAWW